MKFGKISSFLSMTKLHLGHRLLCSRLWRIQP